ncbi:hypothetical protein LTR36_002066 [Oleoguttula mirabilis]|uniref:Uncharacterized protein n=1 Tax=Oleoguttula mirabilis TaxID=1507867 RepID=A0AAV9JMA8_9PEZI|nr:hypothetical protein LTR36_002066 [Oleoguttula mirabilis]
MFLNNLLAALSAVASIVHARAVVAERDTTSIGELYGYATNISGLPLFYGDGVAYIGNVRPQNISFATNVTFAEVDEQLVASPTNLTLTTDGNWTTPRLFIDQTAGAFDSAGFTTSSNTTVTTTGFTLFGTLLVWESTAGLLESKWYATPTDQEGLWYLKWNVDNVLAMSAVPLVLKNLAPTAE